MKNFITINCFFFPYTSPRSHSVSRSIIIISYKWPEAIFCCVFAVQQHSNVILLHTALIYTYTQTRNPWNASAMSQYINPKIMLYNTSLYWVHHVYYIYIYIYITYAVYIESIVLRDTSAKGRGSAFFFLCFKLSMDGGLVARERARIIATANI